MFSYTGRRNHFGNLVNNTDSTVLTLADTLINQKTKVILTARNWWFLEKSFTSLTQASVQFVPISGQIDRLVGQPYVTVSSRRYTPKEAPSRAFWDQLNFTSFVSDIPEWYFLYAGQLGLFPTPATASNVITFIAKQKVRDLNIADYTTSTISTVATVGTTTTVTTTAGVWHSGMVGRFIRITDGNAASTVSGDHEWYEIATVPSATTLTLTNPYGGTAIAAASAAYAIGQMSIMPEAYDELPIFMALQTYFTSVEPNTNKATFYAAQAKDLYDQMKADHSNRTGGRVLDDGLMEEAMRNPNLFISL